jgi:hypothetical protein
MDALISVLVKIFYCRLTALELGLYVPHMPQSLFGRVFLFLLMVYGASVSLEGYLMVAGNHVAVSW